MIQKLLVIAAGIFLGSVAAAQPNLSVSPAAKNALPGSVFTLGVNIANVDTLHGYEVSIKFNTAVLRCDNVVPGTFINSLLFFSTVRADSANVSHVLVGSGTYVSGSGSLFTAQFTAIGTGTTPISITLVKLRSHNNASIVPFTTTPGSVTIANPAVVYINPTYTSGNAGGHDFGYDAFTTVGSGVSAVAASGTVNIAPATYNESVSITKNLTLTGSGNPTIQNLTLNTPVTTLGGNLQVSGVLTLTSGVLTTGANTITITNDQPGGVVITSGAIAGSICRTIAASNTGVYMFTNLHSRITPGTSQPQTTVCFTSYPGVYPPAAPAGTAMNRYYSINCTPSNFTAEELRVEFLSDENINSIPTLNWGLFRNPGSTWIPVGGVPPFTPGHYYVTAGGINEWSLWAIGDVLNPLPVQIASFTARLARNGNVRLAWRTLSEQNNYGFEVQRANGAGDFQTLSGSFIAGHGTTNTPHDYEFTDVAVGAGRWRYRLVQIDMDGRRNFTDPIMIDVPTSVGNSESPLEFRLFGNSPNPFNPVTNIRFQLPVKSDVVLEVYNLLGGKVAVLLNERLDAGEHTAQWDATSSSGRQVASGIYLLMLKAGNYRATQKMVLAR